jgi:hypothetical protein
MKFLLRLNSLGIRAPRLAGAVNMKRKFYFSRHLPRLGLCLLTLASWLRAVPPETPRLPEEIDDAVAQLSHFTGLKLFKRVDYAVLDRQQLARVLEERAQSELDRKEVQAEERALKKLGLIPQHYDLLRGTLDLLGEQAEAFYDYRKKKMFMVQSERPLQPAVVVHELAHALADQHFDLHKFIKRSRNGENSLARMAVMEGQATWLMYEWLAAKAGQSLRSSPAIAQLMSGSSPTVTSQYPVLDKAPLYMRTSLLFPYTAGLRFQQAVIEKLGERGFAEVYRNPPLNTSEVLHPERYFARERIQEPALPSFPDEKKYRELYSGVLGELDFSILFETYSSRQDAERVAPLWRAGQFQLLEDKRSGRLVLRHASLWESPQAAQQALHLLAQSLKGKWRDCQFSREQPNLIAGQGDDGYFVAYASANAVFALEGLPAPAPDPQLTR